MAIQEDPRKTIVKWWTKIRLLKDQVNKLEKLKELPILAISTLLLKTQIVEFELKQLIFSLDLHLYFNSSSNLIRKIVRTPRDFDNLTLGQLAGQIEQFIDKSNSHITITGKSIGNRKELGILGGLKMELNKLVKIRNKLTHHLLDIGRSFEEVNDDAVRGIEIANKTIDLIEDLEVDIKNYKDKR